MFHPPHLLYSTYLPDSSVGYHPGLPGTKGFPRIHVKPEIAPDLETESISETENTGNSLSNHRVRYYREPDYLFRHKC